MIRCFDVRTFYLGHPPSPWPSDCFEDDGVPWHLVHWDQEHGGEIFGAPIYDDLELMETLFKESEGFIEYKDDYMDYMDPAEN